MLTSIIPTLWVSCYSYASLEVVIHRFTENLQEAVDKLWKGVATVTLTRLTQRCSIFNHLDNKARINQRLRLTVANQQGRVQA
ncbi:hypothetical protein HaloA020_25210 [Halomonas sp. A020]|nr:hypothetical protein HaloA020_25210 [Halomonas sp. A020]